ncbi:hypothetical protein GCM10028832_20590 [Streptomyces sparsus]
MPHFSCQSAASRAPKKPPIAATTKAVATVSLVITVRRYRCSQSTAGLLTSPLARRPRAGGSGLTNPPCRTEPPGSQWLDVLAHHCPCPGRPPAPALFPLSGGPRPRTAFRLLPSHVNNPPRRRQNRAYCRTFEVRGSASEPRVLPAP